jgi:hypothetical protein
MVNGNSSIDHYDRTMIIITKYIRFHNIHAIETLPTFEGPGVFLCDPNNPCKDIMFKNVTNSVYMMYHGRYLCGITHFLYSWNYLRYSFSLR